VIWFVYVTDSLKISHRRNENLKISFWKLGIFAHNFCWFGQVVLATEDVTTDTTSPPVQKAFPLP